MGKKIYHSARGFSLIEMLVATGVLSALALLGGQILLNGMRSQKSISDRVAASNFYANANQYALLGKLCSDLGVVGAEFPSDAEICGLAPNNSLCAKKEEAVIPKGDSAKVTAVQCNPLLEEEKNGEKPCPLFFRNKSAKLPAVLKPSTGLTLSQVRFKPEDITPVESAAKKDESSYIVPLTLQVTGKETLGGGIREQRLLAKFGVVEKDGARTVASCEIGGILTTDPNRIDPSKVQTELVGILDAGQKAQFSVTDVKRIHLWVDESNKPSGGGVIYKDSQGVWRTNLTLGESKVQSEVESASREIAAVKENKKPHKMTTISTSGYYGAQFIYKIEDLIDKGIITKSDLEGFQSQNWDSFRGTLASKAMNRLTKQVAGSPQTCMVYSEVPFAMSSINQNGLPGVIPVSLPGAELKFPYSNFASGSSLQNVSSSLFSKMLRVLYPEQNWVISDTEAEVAGGKAYHEILNERVEFLLDQAKKNFDDALADAQARDISFKSQFRHSDPQEALGMRLSWNGLQRQLREAIQGAVYRTYTSSFGNGNGSGSFGGTSIMIDQSQWGNPLASQILAVPCGSETAAPTTPGKLKIEYEASTDQMTISTEGTGIRVSYSGL